MITPTACFTVLCYSLDFHQFISYYIICFDWSPSWSNIDLFMLFGTGVLSCLDNFSGDEPCILTPNAKHFDSR